MRSRVNRRRWITLLAGLLAIAAFLILSSVVLVWANGLKFNPQTGSFEKTVLVAVEGDLEDVTITINDEIVGYGTPLRVRNLIPGRYQVKVNKAHFRSWQQTFWLKAGQVGLIRDPILIAAEPLVTRSTQLRTVPERSPIDSGLTLENGELRDRGILITRFTAVPNQVHRFNKAYLYQVERELRLFWKEGSQDFLVFTFNSSERRELAIFTATWQVAFNDGDSVILVNLTIPSVANSN